MTFKLEIDLGNDAMREFEHIGAALVNAGNRIMEEGSGTVVEPEDVFSIYDVNGNKVGKCWVSR